MLRDVPTSFQVAFSFAGEQRDLVRRVAQQVENRLGVSSVFFDEWFEHVISGDNADLTLQDIYLNRCELAVVCVSSSYGGKPWTKAEHSAIRARRMQATTPKQEFGILPVRVGDGDVPGIHFNAIVPDLRTKSMSESVDLIHARLKLAR